MTGSKVVRIGSRSGRLACAATSRPPFELPVGQRRARLRPALRVTSASHSLTLSLARTGRGDAAYASLGRKAAAEGPGIISVLPGAALGAAPVLAGTGKAGAFVDLDAPRLPFLEDQRCPHTQLKSFMVWSKFCIAGKTDRRVTHLAR